MARCVFPITLKRDGQYMEFPCGSCFACLSRRVSQWSFRLRQEEKSAHSALFVTLTYDDIHLPYSSYPTLHKPDLQSFLKRLRQYEIRKRKNNHKVVYYACGEYGDESQRPHYHLILFNASYDGVVDSWKDSSGYAMGHVKFGDVSAQSIGYVCGYVNKGRIIPAFDGDDRVKEFSLMSKGIGKGYVTPEIVAWHNSDARNRFYVSHNDEKTSMPRYFKSRLFSEDVLKDVQSHLREVMDLELLELEPVDLDLRKDQIRVLENQRKTKRKTQL